MTALDTAREEVKAANQYLWDCTFLPARTADERLRKQAARFAAQARRDAAWARFKVEQKAAR